MEGSPNKINMKTLAQAMATCMLKETHKTCVSGLGPVLTAWAKEFGANFEDEEQALKRLQDLLPEPTNWPVVELVPGSGLKTNTGPPKAPTRKVEGLKAGDFTKIEVPDGVTPPTCPAVKKSGKDKGSACGKPSKYLLPEHDTDNPECAALTCNHCYCGTHITKAATEDTAAYDRLNAATNSDNRPVNIGGDTAVNTSNLAALNEDTGKEVGDSVMDGLLAKFQSQ